MITADAVSTRCPALARHAQAALSLAVILGEPINPIVFFENDAGEVGKCEAVEPVSLEEISEQAQLLAAGSTAGATISYFPAVIDCGDTGIEVIAIVTHDLLLEEVTLKFCLVLLNEDDEPGQVEVTVLDEDGLREYAGA